MLRNSTKLSATLVLLALAVALMSAACSEGFGLKADKVRGQPSSEDDSTGDTSSSDGTDSQQSQTDPQGTDQGGSSSSGGSGSNNDGGGVAPELSQTGFQPGVPSDWPDDVPVPDGASEVAGADGSALPLPGGDGKALVLTLPGTPAEVAQAYANSLAAQGWTDSPLLAMYGASPGTTPGESAIIKSKGDRTIIAMPSPAADGKTQLIVMVVTGDLMSLMQQGLDHPPTS